jgi:glycosyltransferase involved in cell wall biosynthesis
MPTISVIIPCYNRAHLLQRAINSVLEQTYQDFQLIIVDDCSKDNTESVVTTFNDPRIRYFRHEHNKGAPATRNTGLSQSSGDYIAFLDSDDAWLPTKLEEQMAAFENEAKECGLVFCRLLKEGVESKSPPALNDNATWQKILVSNFVGTFSTPLIRKKCFETSGLMDETLQSSQDWDLWIRIAQNHRFFYIEKPLVVYFPQANSITRTDKAKYQGYRAIKEKYAVNIKKLPYHLRSDFHFNIGVNYYWNSYFAFTLYHFICSLLFNPAQFFNIITFIKARIKRMLEKISLSN